MSSTMLDQYLLAVANSGLVFHVRLAEMNGDGTREKFSEYISLTSLPVIDAYKFHTPSPIGFGENDEIETHLPFDISRPELVGFQTLERYLEATWDPHQRGVIIDTANFITGVNSRGVMRGIFQKLVERNQLARMNNATIESKRLFTGVSTRGK